MAIPEGTYGLMIAQCRLQRQLRHARAHTGQREDARGRHETTNCSTISGWAWDAFQPNTPISVDIYSDGVLLATVPAGDFRQDLPSIGIGNGNHGFSFTPPASVTSNGTPRAITIKFSGTQIFVFNTGQGLSCIAPGVPTPPYGGFVDQVTWTEIGRHAPFKFLW